MKRIFLLITLMEFFACNEPILKPDSVIAIPLGGNTYITEGADKTRRKRTVKDEGIRGWSDSSDVYSVYFRTSSTGKLNLFLTYGNADKSTVSVKYLEKQFTVKLNSNKNDTIYAGTVFVKDTGYIKIDLRGIAKAGNSYADINKLLISGEAAKGKLHFVNSFDFYWGRRGPSVHLAYPLPKDENIEWFYNEITVPEEKSPAGTYYMSNGFGEGYFGIQINSHTERRVLFSVWSPFRTDNPEDIPEDMKVKLLKKGENVRTGEFGNEGAGGQSYMIYPWKTGNTYGFLTKIRPDGKGSTVYTAYFHGDENRWILLASWLRPKTDTYYTGAHSFLENFDNEKGHLSRKGFFHNQWARTVNGKWIEITEARFSADNTARQQARMDYKGGVENGRFFLQNCGFLNDYTTIGTPLSRPATGKAPEIDFTQLNSEN